MSGIRHADVFFPRDLPHDTIVLGRAGGLDMDSVLQLDRFLEKPTKDLLRPLRCEAIILADLHAASYRDKHEHMKRISFAG